MILRIARLNDNVLMTPDEQSIHNILSQLENAWNAGDSQSFAACFAEDATFIHIFGGQLDGRPAIEASHRVIFDTIYKGSHASFTARGIRFIRPDVAMLLAQARVEYKEGGEPRTLDTRPTLLVVKEKGIWQIVALQNTKVSEIPAAAQAAARLAT